MALFCDEAHLYIPQDATSGVAENAIATFDPQLDVDRFLERIIRWGFSGEVTRRATFQRL